MTSLADDLIAQTAVPISSTGPILGLDLGKFKSVG